MDSIISVKQSIVKEFAFDYDECIINENTIIELLGYDYDTVPEPVEESIKYILDVLTDKAKLKSGYKIFKPGKVKLDDKKFIIDNRLFSCGKIIYSSLKNSDSISFLVASIGKDVEEWSRHFMDNNEMLKGYLIDKIASELVEQLADKTEKLLEDELKEIGLKATNRYSPGYCDWSVADQQNLFSLLPPMFCGVSVNSDSLMTPIKSVSAVIGIGKQVEKKDYQCSICDIDFCYKRERHA